MNPRRRTLLYAAVSFFAVWLIAWGGYTLARNSKMTAEKVRAYLTGTDLRKLSAEKRAKALRDLASKINSLTAEERRKYQGGLAMADWFSEMSEQEKGEFLEATMPGGFKQMINAFEELPGEFETHIGLEEHPADFAKPFFDRVLAQHPFAGKALQGIG